MIRAAIILISIFLASCGSLHSLDRVPFSREPAASGTDEEAPGPMRIVAINVGQGDATLVIAPNGEAALIDSGPPGAGDYFVRPVLSTHGVEKLVAIIVTHYHEDHFGGVPEIIDLLSAKGAVYDRGEPVRDPKSSVFPLYESSAAGRRIAMHPGYAIRIGDARMEVVAVDGLLPDGTQVDIGDPPDENSASAALLIEYAGFRMLVPGDITGGGGREPFVTPDIETPLAPFVGDIDVLRVAHHGSQTSTNEEFLSLTKPEAAIISVGDGNDYNHPHWETVERLLNAGIEVYQTERGSLSLPGPEVADGEIEIEVNGSGSYEIKLP